MVPGVSQQAAGAIITVGGTPFFRCQHTAQIIPQAAFMLDNDGLKPRGTFCSWARVVLQMRAMKKQATAPLKQESYDARVQKIAELCTKAGTPVTVAELEAMADSAPGIETLDLDNSGSPDKKPFAAWILQDSSRHLGGTMSAADALSAKSKRKTDDTVRRRKEFVFVVSPNPQESIKELVDASNRSWSALLDEGSLIPHNCLVHHISEELFVLAFNTPGCGEVKNERARLIVNTDKRLTGTCVIVARKAPPAYLSGVQVEQRQMTTAFDDVDFQLDGGRVVSDLNAAEKARKRRAPTKVSA